VATKAQPGEVTRARLNRFQGSIEPGNQKSCEHTMAHSNSPAQEYPNPRIKFPNSQVKAQENIPAYLEKKD
jgi:hypothetical protein